MDRTIEQVILSPDRHSFYDRKPAKASKVGDFLEVFEKAKEALSDGGISDGSKNGSRRAYI